jgi:hypothetical protein
MSDVSLERGDASRRTLFMLRRDAEQTGGAAARVPRVPEGGSGRAPFPSFNPI